MCLSVPGKLLERNDVGGVLVGKVQFGGIVREVCLDLLPEAKAGEYLLVHVGYAISLVDEEEARKSYEYMELAGMLEGELTAFPDDGPAPAMDASPPKDDFAPRTVEDAARASGRGAAMKYLDEYRDEKLFRSQLARLTQIATRPWVLMEVCGGQTHTLVRYGIDELLPAGMEMVHGPGCPVCVTPVEIIDKAIALARRPHTILVSYGDMMRVPGSESDLLQVKALGGDVRMVYSPTESVRIALENPASEVVFFGVGFETTAPANAMVAWQAKRQGIKNLSLLSSHVLVPPAVEMLLSSPHNRVQGLIAPGHVCTIMGTGAYEAVGREVQGADCDWRV